MQVITKHIYDVDSEGFSIVKAGTPAEWAKPGRLPRPCVITGFESLETCGHFDQVRCVDIQSYFLEINNKIYVMPEHIRLPLPPEINTCTV